MCQVIIFVIEFPTSSHAQKERMSHLICFDLAVVPPLDARLQGHSLGEDNLGTATKNQAIDQIVKATSPLLPGGGADIGVLYECDWNLARGTNRLSSTFEFRPHTRYEVHIAHSRIVNL